MFFFVKYAKYTHTKFCYFTDLIFTPISQKFLWYNKKMTIYKINKEKIEEIKEEKIKLERDLQRITEDNLQEIFNLDFVRSEFQLQNLRIDSLAYDKTNNSFIIIEYKRDKSFSLIDQGYSYLALMLNNKADFILEYNQKKNKNFKKDDIDWSQSKVLFLANSYTPHQRNAINFKDLPIELWEVKKYANNTILFNQIKPLITTESIKTITKNNYSQNSVNNIVKEYTVKDHFNNGWDDVENLWKELDEQILDKYDGIERKINMMYIGYKIGSNNLCTIHTYKSRLDLSLPRVEKEDLNDPANKIKEVKWRENGWGKSCKVEIKNKEDIEYAFFLIDQLYEKLF